jgi:hypothetical protein
MIAAGPDDDEQGERRDGHPAARQVITGALVVIGTLGIWIAAVTGQQTGVRWGAAVLGVLAASCAIGLARRRGNIVGWFVLACAVASFRIVTQ